MADIKALIHNRQGHINDLLRTVLRGNGIDLIESLQDSAEDLLDIDEELISAAQNGADIRGYLTTAQVSSTVDLGQVREFINRIELEMDKEGWTHLTPSKMDRERVEAILWPKAPRTSEGSVLSMVKTTTNKEKLFARGMLLYDRGYYQLARPFFGKLAQSFGLPVLDKSAWSRQSNTEVDISEPFQFTEAQKVETFDSLLVLARTLLDRKIMNDSEVEQDALRALVGLLGIQALRVTQLNGDS